MVQKSNTGLLTDKWMDVKILLLMRKKMTNQSEFETGLIPMKPFKSDSSSVPSIEMMK